jgi:uncharacterized damage-inducible protein DinB
MTEELSKLQQTFSDVADFANAYPTALRTVKPDEIAFSATEILYHLIDVEYLWQRRIKQLITTTERQFTRIDPDGLAKEKRYNEKNFEKGIEEWFEAREETIDLIEEMSESERRIAGSHPKFGEIDTHAIVQIMLDHDKQHLAQLKRTLRQVENK